MGWQSAAQLLDRIGQASGLKYNVLTRLCMLAGGEAREKAGLKNLMFNI